LETFSGQVAATDGPTLRAGTALVVEPRSLILLRAHDPAET
jgi:hypothetical protein